MLPQSSNEANTTCKPGTGDGWEPEHRAVHRRLCEYARHRSVLDAAEALDLVRAEQFKLYALHACASHYEYMERILGYGPHAARERMRVARALVRLPETTAALARGELSYSAARELTRVATDETEAAWLDRAKGLVVNQIERLVASHQVGDLPDDPPSPDLKPRVVRLELPPEAYALWRQARMVVADERGTELSDADLVETLCRAAIAPGTSASGPAHQIAYQQCPDCRRATQNGAGRQIDVAPEVFERASCDAKDLGSLDAAAPERAATTVTPRVREQVFARDHHRCTVPGCRSARNLDIHHIEFQSHGGGHELYNMTLLCSGHHSALHAGLLTMKGQAPYQIEFRWVYRAPIPVGLDPAAREAMVAQRLEQIFAEIDAIPEDELDDAQRDAKPANSAHGAERHAGRQADADREAAQDEPSDSGNSDRARCHASPTRDATPVPRGTPRQSHAGRRTSPTRRRRCDSRPEPAHATVIRTWPRGRSIPQRHRQVVATHRGCSNRGVRGSRPDRPTLADRRLPGLGAPHDALATSAQLRASTCATRRPPDSWRATSAASTSWCSRPKTSPCRAPR